jgi:predicted TIM-barrel fold metal-dependent hydrolase
MFETPSRTTIRISAETKRYLGNLVDGEVSSRIADMIERCFLMSRAAMPDEDEFTAEEWAVIFHCNRPEFRGYKLRRHGPPRRTSEKDAWKRIIEYPDQNELWIKFGTNIDVLADKMTKLSDLQLMAIQEHVVTYWQGKKRLRIKRKKRLRINEKSS